MLRMRNRAAFALGLVLLGLVWAGAPFAAGGAELKHVVGTAVSLAPPAGFKPTPTGYALPTSGAMIAVVELPDAAFEQLGDMKDQSFWTKLIEQNHLPITAGKFTSEVLTVNGREFALISTEMDFQGYAGDMWMAVSGPNPTVSIQFIQVHAPGVQVALTRDVVLKLLGSVVLAGPTPFTEKLLSTGLTLQPKAPFTADQQVFAAGFIMLSATKDRSQDHDAPMVEILVLPAGSEKMPLDALADHYARDEEGALTELKRREAYFVGAAGLRFEGMRKSALGADQRFIEYVSIVDGQAYVLLGAGRVGDMPDDVLKIVDEIAASVQKQPARSPA